jgi:hypothetical protein
VRRQRRFLRAELLNRPLLLVLCQAYIFLPHLAISNLTDTLRHRSSVELFGREQVQKPARTQAIPDYSQPNDRSAGLSGRENRLGYAGLVRFSEKRHIIPANKAGGIVALRPDFQPIAKGSDYIDPGSFVDLSQNP